MNLQDYIAIVWRRKYIVVVTTIITTLIAALSVLIVAESYSATAMLRITTAKSGSSDFVSYDVFYTDRLMNTYVKIAKSGFALTELRKQLGIEELPEITVEILPNTELMTINVEGADPVQVAQVANLLAAIIVEENRGRNLTIVDMAVVPTDPSGPNSILFVAIGLIMGGAGSIGLTFLLQSFDKTTYSIEKIEEVTRLSILGKIPSFQNSDGRVFLFGPAQTQAAQTKRGVFASLKSRMSDLPTDKQLVEYEKEAFRRLRINLDVFSERNEAKTFLVTSTQVGEGKSIVTANLAAVLALSGKRVAIIDGDLRRPTVHKLFGLPENNVGLSSVLSDKLKWPEVIIKSDVPNVHIIPSGRADFNPHEQFSTIALKELLHTLRLQFDIVLVDGPSLLGVSDAGVLAQIVDQVLLVVAQGISQEPDIIIALKQLNAVNASILGVIVNQAERDSGYNDYFSPQQLEEVIS